MRALPPAVPERLHRFLPAIAIAALVAAALLAPVWASVSGNPPDRTNASPDDTVVVHGERRSVIDETGTPLGPTWGGSFLLGADADGRDVAVRLLYGARTSLFVGLAATLLTMVLAVAVALASGYLRGRVDAVAGGALDVLWAFPVILIAIALGVALDRASILVPVLIIALVYVPYAARPLRAQVLSLREREFVDAARVSGAEPAAGDVVRAAAQPGPHPGRAVPAAGGQRDPAGGGAVLPGRGRELLDSLVGHDARRRPGADDQRAARLDRARADAAGRRARAELAGRAGAMIARTLLRMVLVLFAVSVLVFLIFQVIPGGDPAERMAGRGASAAQVEAVRKEWGFDRSLPAQYVTTMRKALTGDLVSYKRRVDVDEEIWRRLPVTLSLALGAVMLSVVLGVGFGVLGALYVGRWPDHLLAFVAAAGGLGAR